MNPIVILILKILGQVGVVHIHPTDPPQNKLLIWIKTDPNTGLPIAFLDYTRGHWYPIAQVEVVDNFNSASSTKAASARTVRHLYELISDLTETVDEVDDSLADYVLLSMANQAGGYPKIDTVTGKISSAFVNVSGFKPQGRWDASTGDPPSLAPSAGEIWSVGTAGNTDLDGHSNWAKGDFVYRSENNTYEHLPGFNMVIYSGLDQEVEGFALDATYGKILKDSLDSLILTVNNLSNLYTTLEGRVDVAEQEIEDLKDKKQPIIIRLRGTIQNKKFTTPELENTDLDSWDVFVDGQMMVGAIMEKEYASTSINFPAGYPNDTPILIKRYPLP